MVQSAKRIRAKFLWGEPVVKFWGELEDSDPDEHEGCGWIPTGKQCYQCLKPLGKEMRPGFSYQIDFLVDDHMIVYGTGGEQAGKTESASMKGTLVVLAFLGEYADTGKAAGQVAWITAVNYELTSQELERMGDWLEEWPFTIERTNKSDPGHIRIKVKGGHFTIKTRSVSSAMGTRALRAESPIVTIVCEAATFPQDGRNRLRTRVARARRQFPGYGSIIYSGTFEGSLGWYPTDHARYQSPAMREKMNASSHSMPSFSNIFVYREGEDDVEIQALKDDPQISEQEYSERVEAIPAPPKGRVHPSFDVTIHVQHTKYSEDLSVGFGMDPGWSGASSSYAVEAIQRRHILDPDKEAPLECSNPHWQIIDEIFENGKFVEQIIDMAEQRFWWGNPDKIGVIDVAGKAHAGARESNTEIWHEKTGINLRAERISIRDSRNRIDSLLKICPECGEPFLIIDPRCTGIISEFGGDVNPHDGEVHVYSWARDKDGNITGTTPNDDWCDGIKAVAYWFINRFGHTNRVSDRKKIKVRSRKARAQA